MTKPQARITSSMKKQKPSPAESDHSHLFSLLASPLRLKSLLPGLEQHLQFHHRRTPGAPPGIEQIAEQASPPDPERVTIRVTDYGPEGLVERSVHLHELDTLLTEEKPEQLGTRWINVDGLSPHLIARFQRAFDLHTLAAEDVLHLPQRPKAEAYGQQLFVVSRMLHTVDGRLVDEQVSFFLLPNNILLSFQQSPGDVWEPVRERIRKGIPRIRESGADYLLYALLDAQVDHGFPLLERYGDSLETLEEALIERPDRHLLARLHAIKRELTLLRRVIWPTRDLIGALYRDGHALIRPETATFLRDVHDHGVQLLDVIETYREIASSLGDLYINAVSQRTNEVMKTLTIMASIFIPITFLAGVYGMNFEHMPELAVRWAYPAVWMVFVSVAVGLLLYFRYRRWF